MVMLTMYGEGVAFHYTHLLFALGSLTLIPLAYNVYKRFRKEPPFLKLRLTTRVRSNSKGNAKEAYDALMGCFQTKTQSLDQLIEAEEVAECVEEVAHTC